LGWGDLGVFGSDRFPTPELDRLAAQGTLFTEYYVANPVCSPSRAAFLTGRYPAAFGIHGHFASIAANAARGMPQYLDPALPNVARLLRDTGYATAHIGKWHLRNNVAALLPEEPAEDIGQGPPPEAYGFDFVGSGEPFGANGPVDDPHYRARSTAVFVDEAIAFMQAPRPGPFYLQLWTSLPHATLNPTPGQLAPFRSLRAGHAGQPFPFASALEVYAASIADLDTQIGRLFDALEELGLADNTLVFFTSDNGPEDIHIGNSGHSGVGRTGPFRGRKRSLYEGGIRVPAIVRWPGQVPEGRVDDRNVLSALDWLPTVARVAGVESPPVDGDDSGDVWRGATRDRRVPLFWEWRYAVAGASAQQSPRLAVREGPWKLLLNPDGSREELFHLPSDPAEQQNRATAEPEVTARLREQVLAWGARLPAGPAEASAGRIVIRGPGLGRADPELYYHEQPNP
jgi:N-acetylgalactosamine-6-sulfatase